MTAVTKELLSAGARGEAGGSLESQQHIVVSNVSWDTYCALVEDLGEDRVRITYDEGKAELMSPLPEHDPWGRHAYRLLDVMCLERGIELFPLGGTTFRSARKRKGLEPDESFYVNNIDAARRLLDERRHFEEGRDPPPDLAIEIEITRRVVPRMPVYAALGVPEVWRYDGQRILAMLLRGDGYQESSRSGLFPFLPLDEFAAWVGRSMRQSGLKVIPEFRQWVASLKT